MLCGWFVEHNTVLVTGQPGIGVGVFVRLDLEMSF
jgi:hypothetical protein